MSKPRPALPFPIVLASSSPRRRELLHGHGYRFETATADVAEVAPAHLTIAETTLWNAKLKAAAISHTRPRAVVIGADTLVSLSGEALGKPRDRGEAVAMLSRLSGRTHQVFTGVWLAQAETGKARGFVEVSHVRFRLLRLDEIDAYLARIHVLDKAGAYAAQEDPLRIIAGIRGSRTNVIGLPMAALGRELRAFAHQA